MSSGLSIDQITGMAGSFLKILLVGFNGIVVIQWVGRLPDIDKVQIMRWKAFGPRHIGAIKKNCAENNYLCRPRQRQGLLQWAYNPFF